MSFPSDRVIPITNFDGQIVWYEKSPLIEIGNFLGGGAAGTVYECEYIKTKERFALKILNPLGYKLMTPALLRKCNILTKGKPATDDNDPNISKNHVWWLLNNSTKQYISAFFSEKSNSLKELSLSQCVSIWTANPAEVDTIDDENPSTNLELLILPTGQRIYIPKLPPKFVEFIRKRSRIFREINNMRKISNHPNVIRLEGVLESVQDTKCTIFLLMELANGGELFDRIKVDFGTREETAKFFFQQLLDGVKHCHDQGVCHRDLKPENLLLQDTSMGDKGTILKIADFGFSARFAMGSGSDENWSQSIPPQNYRTDNTDNHMLSGSPVRVLKSIVGSPFYVAPEILQARGYDGSKADIWSLGVILYAMLAGNLPFGQDLSTCKRFKTFCKWIRQYNLKGIQLWDNPSLDFPDWLFPAKFSTSSKGLIISMLHPDPLFRISVADAMQHPLCIADRTAPLPLSNDGVLLSSSQISTYKIPNSDVDMELNDATQASVESEYVENGDNNDEDEDDIDDDKNDNDIEEKQSDYDDQSGVFMMEEDSDFIESPKVVDVKSSLPPKGNVSPRSESSKHVVFGSTYQQMNPSFSTTSNSLLSEAGSFLERNSFYLASSPSGTKPPLAPHLIAPHSIDDLITDMPAELDEYDLDSPFLGLSRHLAQPSSHYDGTPPMKSTLRRERSGDEMTNIHPPNFNDTVKKSTRFITSVPAYEVLVRVEKILKDCHMDKTVTPIGLIGRVELDWDTFRLEVWNQDLTSPSVCALQLYQLPTTYESASSTPSRNPMLGESPSMPMLIPQPGYIASSPYQASFSYSNATPSGELYLVEFVRGQIEIFAFKRFYQWLRQRISELVKRDYSMMHFDHSISPKVNYSLLDRVQQYS